MLRTVSAPSESQSIAVAGVWAGSALTPQSRAMPTVARRMASGWWKVRETADGLRLAQPVMPYEPLAAAAISEQLGARDEKQPPALRPARCVSAVCGGQGPDDFGAA